MIFSSLCPIIVRKHIVSLIGDFGGSMAGGFFTGTPSGSQPTPGEKKVFRK